MKNPRYIVFLSVVGVIFLLFSPQYLISADFQDVVINEVAWMGTDASTADEFVELYNNTDSNIDLTGWTLTASDGDPDITLSGTIPAHGYFLLERTDDNTVSDIAADQIYSGNLSNSGEKIILKDGSGKVIDEVDCSGGWFAGTSTPKATMERLHPQIGGSSSESWDTNDGTKMNGKDANGDSISGTPKSQNSSYDISLSVTMNSFYAFMSQGTIVLRWRTESEVGCQGFHVLRSENQDDDYKRITTAIIPGQGHSSTGADYEFIDRYIQGGKGYWYKIEEISMSGEVHEFGPIYAFPETGLNVPEDFSLVGNFPNPFNPKTTIQYAVSEAGLASRTAIRIFDMLGREVVTLVDRIHQPGYYTVHWDGCDLKGREVSSGLYVYQLTADGYPLDTKRMTKLK